MIYSIICYQRIYQKAFLNWLCKYLSFLNIFFSIDFARWKSVELPHSTLLISRFINFTLFVVLFIIFVKYFQFWQAKKKFEQNPVKMSVEWVIKYLILLPDYLDVTSIILTSLGFFLLESGINWYAKSNFRTNLLQEEW